VCSSFRDYVTDVAAAVKAEGTATTLPGSTVFSWLDGAYQWQIDSWVQDRTSQVTPPLEVVVHAADRSGDNRLADAADRALSDWSSTVAAVRVWNRDAANAAFARMDDDLRVIGTACHIGPATSQ
jgi:hypothetical protein